MTKEQLYQRAAELYRQAVADGADEAQARAKYDAAVARIASMPDVPAPNAGTATAKPTPADPRTDFGFGRSVAQGVTFGFADEIEAGAKSLLPGRTYDEEVADVRAGKAKYEAEHPGRAFAGEMVGGLLTSAVPVAGAAKLAQGASKARQVAAMMGAGAASGGLSGLGTAEGALPERLPQAATAAGVGAVLSPVIGSVVGKVASSRAGRATAELVRRGVNTVRGGAREAVEMLPAAREKALRYAGRAFERDRASLPEALSAGADAGDLVFNRGGRSVATATRVAQAIPSEATDYVPRAIAAQLDDEPGRVVDALSRATGRPLGNADARLQELTDDAAARAKPLYEAIRGQFLPVDETLSKIAQRPSVADAIELAKRNLLDAGEAIPDGYTVGLIDDAKKVMDDQIESIEEAIAKGVASGKDKARVRSLRSARDQLVRHTDELLGGPDVSPYAKARAAAGEGIAPREAFREGRGYGPATSRDALELAQAARNPAEREAFAEGVAHRIRDDVERTQDRRNIASRFFGSPLERDKLASVFGEASPVGDALSAATRRREQATAALVPGQSMTTPLREGVDDFRGGSLVELALQAKSLPRTVLTQLARRVAQLRGVDEEAAAILGRIMTARPGSSEALQLAAQFQRLELQRGAAQRVGQLLGQTGGAAAVNARR